MAAPTDKVQLAKYESAAGGGDAADENDGYTAQLEDTEDAPSVAGLYVGADGTAYLSRELTELVAKDSVANGGAEIALAKLWGAIRGRDVDEAALADNVLLRYSASAGKWLAQALGAAPTVANIQQLAVSQFSVSVDTSWQTIFSFIYGGTSAWGALAEMKALTEQSSTATGRTHDIRIWDRDNSQVIASATGLSHGALTIATLGTPANLPAAESVFDIQIQRSGGSFQLDFHTLSVKGE